MGEERPEIQTITSGSQLRRWYWLKEELVGAAKVHGVKSTGGKFVILGRICHFLDHGETVWPGDTKAKITSKFDWHSADLTPETVLTDSYKNTQNVRRFFLQHIGPKFKFNIEFMDWIKAHTGLTLADAVDEFHDMQRRIADPAYRTDIKSHNQFNQYTRDFLDDNPDAGMAQVRRVWAAKRKLPSDDGRHVYHRDDLKLIS